MPRLIPPNALKRAIDTYRRTNRALISETILISGNFKNSIQVHCDMQWHDSPRDEVIHTKAPYISFDPDLDQTQFPIKGNGFLHFLKTETGLPGELARQRMNAWIELWRYEDRSSVLSRFQSSRDETSRGAFWELYVNAFLLWQKCDVRRIPEVHGSPSPDFLITKDGKEFYVEATTIQMSREKQEHERRFEMFKEYLNQRGHDRYCIGVAVTRKGDSSIKSKFLYGSLISWLDSLTIVDNVFPKFELEANDWAFSFTAFPKSGDEVSFIQFSMHSVASTLKDDIKLRSSIKEKSHRYRKLDLDYPLILFIEEEESSFGGVEVSRAGALFGDLQVHFSLTDGSSKSGRAPNGAWVSKSGLTNRIVSAVMISRPVFLRAEFLPTPEIWLHPQPVREWDPPFHFPLYFPKDGQMIFRDGALAWTGFP